MSEKGRASQGCNLDLAVSALDMPHATPPFRIHHAPSSCPSLYPSAGMCSSYSCTVKARPPGFEMAPGFSRHPHVGENSHCSCMCLLISSRSTSCRRGAPFFADFKKLSTRGGSLPTRRRGTGFPPNLSCLTILFYGLSLAHSIQDTPWDQRKARTGQ
jgi:hypothetical protein